MKKILLFFILLFLTVLVGIVLARDVILKAAVEQAVTGTTGFKTHVDSLHYELPSTLHIEGLGIDNPPGFTEKVFVRIPEIYASVILPELLQGKRVHLPEVRLNIKEVHLEKNPHGISNVQLLSSVGAKGGAKKKTAPTSRPAGEKKPGMPFLLERLELTLRNVTYQDRAGMIGSVPVNKLTMDLRIEKQVFVNITDPRTLVNLILTKVLQEGTLGRLMGLDPRQLLDQDLSQFVSTGKEFVGQQAKMLGQQVENVGGTTLQGSVGEAKTLLGSTTNTAQQKLSGFLGKLKTLQSGDSSSNKT